MLNEDKMMDTKKGVVWIPILVIFLVVGIFVILAEIGQITIFGHTFYIISPSFKYEVNFWIFALIWIVIQVAFIYAYAELGKLIIKWFNFVKVKYKDFFEISKKIFASS